jgi:hypothetical protein
VIWARSGVIWAIVSTRVVASLASPGPRRPGPTLPPSSTPIPQPPGFPHRICLDPSAGQFDADGAPLPAPHANAGTEAECLPPDQWNRFVAIMGKRLKLLRSTITAPGYEQPAPTPVKKRPEGMGSVGAAAAFGQPAAQRPAAPGAPGAPGGLADRMQAYLQQQQLMKAQAQAALQQQQANARANASARAAVQQRAAQHMLAGHSPHDAQRMAEQELQNLFNIARQAEVQKAQKAAAAAATAVANAAANVAATAALRRASDEFRPQAPPAKRQALAPAPGAAGPSKAVEVVDLIESTSDDDDFQGPKKTKAAAAAPLPPAPTDGRGVTKRAKDAVMLSQVESVVEPAGEDAGSRPPPPAEPRLKELMGSGTVGGGAGGSGAAGRSPAAGEHPVYGTFGSQPAAAKDGAKKKKGGTPPAGQRQITNFFRKG